MFSHCTMSGRWGSRYKPLCRYPREPSNETILTRSAFWALTATSYIWKRTAKKCFTPKNHENTLIQFHLYHLCLHCTRGKAALPAEHSEWEPSDRPLNGGTGWDFSFSSNCSIRKQLIGFCW